MLLKVYNIETAKVEKVDSSKLTKNHTHVNTRKAFTEEQLKSFWIKK